VTQPETDAAGVEYEYHALTAERWGDLEALFGPKGAYSGCWCMWWRLPGPEWNANRGESNRQALKGVVSAGEHVGVLAYASAEPVGWCAIAPRNAYLRLREERVRIFKKVDDLPVWTITCFYVNRYHRRKGLTLGLLRAAVEYAVANGATIVEGYPVDPEGGKMAAASAYTGLLSTFEKAGFVEVTRRHGTRPIMRYFAEGAPQQHPQPAE
jgi:GNAT superfamily N-acetyltransferase